MTHQEPANVKHPMLVKPVTFLLVSKFIFPVSFHQTPGADCLLIIIVIIKKLKKVL